MVRLHPWAQRKSASDRPSNNRVEEAAKLQCVAIAKGRVLAKVGGVRPWSDGEASKQAAQKGRGKQCGPKALMQPSRLGCVKRPGEMSDHPKPLMQRGATMTSQGRTLAYGETNKTDMVDVAKLVWHPERKQGARENRRRRNITDFKCYEIAMKVAGSSPAIHPKTNPIKIKEL